MSSFNATIDRFEGDNVVLRVDDAHVTLPRTHLPTDVAEGDVLRITIQTDNQASATKNKQAKDLLNEILKTNTST